MATLAVGVAAACVFLGRSGEVSAQPADPKTPRPEWCKEEEGDDWIRVDAGDQLVYACFNERKTGRCAADHASTTWYWNVKEQRCAETAPAVPCFLTTACCGLMDLADDCWELETLRSFRDDYLAASGTGRDDVETYYAVAPRIVEAIRRSPDPKAELSMIYAVWILPCAIMARIGLDAATHRHYRNMMRFLMRRHGVAAV